ncbi:MAG: ABC transporter ATP-binding protein [Treponema sp.]|nr:ABC transporter ATP-binding protein [Treponema sp.]
MLSIKNLKKRFNLEAGFFAKTGQYVYAVNDVSFEVADNETYGLVGESGCGKSTTARLIVKMYEPDSGEIIFNGQNVRKLSGRALKEYRERVKYIFQDPAKSLNPRMSIFEILTCGLRYSKKWQGKQKARELAGKILCEVGLTEADLDRRPSEFSGGQRQRISIARALLMEPEFLICDEVVSALDVSIQGQILNLLQEIRQNRKLSMLFITHDLKVSCYFCDRIGVMYNGVLMEEANAKDLYKIAKHPYTKLLFASVAGEKKSDTVLHNGEKLSKAQEVKIAKSTLTACPFVERCKKAKTSCSMEMPQLVQIAPGHKVRCSELQIND